MVSGNVVKLRLVEKAKRPERDRESLRPFRIWDQTAHRTIPHRNYKSAKAAIERAIVIAHYDLKVGNRFEVHNIRTGRQVGVFWRSAAGGLMFTKGD